MLLCGLSITFNNVIVMILPALCCSLVSINGSTVDELKSNPIANKYYIQRELYQYS